MSDQTQEPDQMGTKPVKEHEWLQKLVGEWRVETDMLMGPGQPMAHISGTETVKSVGGLWAFSVGRSNMPDGTPMEHYSTLGYDVSFKEYRGCWFISISSHLWKQVGTLSADGRIMTLDCVGPNMTKDGEMSNYREVTEIIDENRRTLTAYIQADNGEWEQYMTSSYTRV